MSGKKEAAIWLTVGAGIVGLFIGGIHQQGKEEARPWCYENISRFYTWKDLRPLVDKVVADEFINRSECDNLEAAHNEAKTKQQRRIYLKDFKK